MDRFIKSARKVGATVLGFSLLIIGVILLILPGPGLLVIILGLIVLSWEYEWARHHLHKAKEAQNKTITKFKEKRSKKNT